MTGSAYCAALAASVTADYAALIRPTSLAYRPAAYLKAAGVGFIPAKSGERFSVRLVRGYQLS